MGTELALYHQGQENRLDTHSSPCLNRCLPLFLDFALRPGGGGGG